MTRQILCSSALAMAIALGSAAAKPAGEMRNASAYREAAETAAIASADVAPVYEAALRFYRPPRNQARWLELPLLPASEAGAEGSLDRALAEALVTRLGKRFCLLEKGNPCEGANGVALRVSEIYASSADRVRVVVAARLVWAGSERDNGRQAFVLSRTPKGWKIDDRYGVGS